MSDTAVETSLGTDVVGTLAARVTDGEVFVVRGLLQECGLLDAFVDTTVEAIRRWGGDETADLVRERGFENLHECVEPDVLPELTDAVYAAMETFAPTALRRLMRTAFPELRRFYFEAEPNVRFHIPFDRAFRHRKRFDAYRSAGKITAHGPHRDSWLDCPVNAVNIWIAIGPVRRGNGLSIFVRDTPRELRRQVSGEVHAAEQLRPPQCFELEPGDAVLFRGDHVHGSELNRTAQTRYVVSFRLTFRRPVFRSAHRHQYLDSRLVTGRLRPIAHVPAKLRLSYLRTRLRGKAEAVAEQPRAADPESFDIVLADLPPGTVRAVSRSVCVARLASGEVRAFGRHCPHSGADLTRGWVQGDDLVCAWHNLPFDGRTGESPCSALRPLRRYRCEVVDGVVRVGDRLPAAAGGEAG